MRAAGLLCAVVALTGVAAVFAFLANLGGLGIDQGAPGAMSIALLIDVALLLAFGVHHSGMARTGYKEWLASVAPRALERSVFVAASGAMLWVIVVGWRPLPDPLITVEGPTRAAMWAVYGLGWGITGAGMASIDILALFGLRQTGIASAREEAFRLSWMHRRVRHPIYTGLVLVFFGTPDMTLGHALFAVGMTLYIGIGIAFEERDLVRRFGDTYRTYRDNVPALFPRLTAWRGEEQRSVR